MTEKIEGYRPQSDEHVNMVNRNKRLEESILVTLDLLAQLPEIDKRWLAIGRTEIEKGFMAVNRAIMQPQRLSNSSPDPSRVQ